MEFSIKWRLQIKMECGKGQPLYEYPTFDLSENGERDA